ncbi:MAG: dicarboxylate/amino acid:cation symporter [Myxococcota bacterium]|jgi:Na+/H+-dicarboxylate symporter|nr:dicarboxylate/amino acid:cation symporter [Myxococcota bacterium]
MWGIKFHWWVIIGIVAGVIIGTALNRTYLPEVRQAVLGTSYTAADLQEHGNALTDALAVRIRENIIGGALDGIAHIFMNLLKMVVIPLVFFSLVSGILGMGGGDAVGRVGLKTLGWYLSTSLIAIVVGLLTVNIMSPGVGADIRIPTSAREAHAPESFWDVLSGMVPSNVFKAMAEFDMFGIILFSLFVGIFLVKIEAEKRQAMTNFIETGSTLMMGMTHFVVSLAPVGIMCLVGFTVATSGPEVFLSMFPYVITVFVALGLHIFVMVPLLVWLVTKRNPYLYMKAMSAALITGFSTASSAGTLAVTMEEAQSKAGISNRVTSFVLPLGATVNMDGTALYECVTVLFIAQVHASVDPSFAALSLTSQLMIVFLALAVSIGAAGIPHAGLVMMVIILNAVNLPLEYTALVWAVDRVLDMCRTVTNIWSDSCGALVIAHSEKQIDESILFDASKS